MTIIQDKKGEFKAFVKVLAERYKPLYIYCFGESVKSMSRSGCSILHDAVKNHRYYLLMIVENEIRIEHPVQDYANTHFHHGKITILVHGKETVTAAIRANDRFFITAAKQGKLMYSYDPAIASFQVPAYIPTRAAQKAEKRRIQKMFLATGFLESAKQCFIKENYPLCIYMLHQVVEQCCIGLIGVHLAYRSDIHNLYRLLHLCEIFSAETSQFFLEQGQEGIRLFDLMVKSYSAARYKDDFQAERSDAETLYAKVAAFLKLSEGLCKNKIEALALDAEIYKQHKSQREVCCG